MNILKLDYSVKNLLVQKKSIIQVVDAIQEWMGLL